MPDPNLSSFLWSVADLLRGDYKQSDYGKIILPFPTDMFYNTGIATYIWILSNRKTAQRRGKVHLIDATAFWQKMRKSLGSKRKELRPDHIADITQIFGNFKKLTRAGVPISRIFKNEDFGYRTITVERPQRDAKGAPSSPKRQIQGPPPRRPVPARHRKRPPLRGHRNLFQTRSPPPRPRRLDRPRQNQDWLRNPL